MNGRTGRAALAAAALLAGGVLAAGDASNKEVTAALKDVTRATKGVRGLVADVEFSEVVDKHPIHGTGKLWVHFGGILRAEIGGDVPRTILFTPPWLYIYRHADAEVDVWDVGTNPDRLGQYLTLGFVPNGTALKVGYEVELVRRAELDGQPMRSFLLTPKSAAAAHAIGRIQLWVDPATGFPAQHQVVHATAPVQLTVRYLHVTRDDALPDSLFKPDWPAEATVKRN